VTYALCFFVFSLLSLFYAKIRKQKMRIVQHAVSGFVCALAVYGMAYILLHITAARTYTSQVIPLRPLLRSDRTTVFVLAISVKDGENDKKDLHVVSVNKVDAPALVVFSEGEARLLAETRRDGVLEKRTTRLDGWALWFSGDQSWDEYIIHVPLDSIERPKRIDNVL
jgi:hypothetical protein